MTHFCQPCRVSYVEFRGAVSGRLRRRVSPKGEHLLRRSRVPTPVADCVLGAWSWQHSAKNSLVLDATLPDSASAFDAFC